jgi:hypothetical protein
MAEDDARDERLHELLEVEPLDELTRRRLVTAALRESAPASRSRRWVAVAAIVVALVIAGGIALIATRGSNDNAPTALKDQGGRTGAAAAPGRAPEGATPPVDAGDFGDLAVAANLARARAALDTAPSAGATSADRAQSTTAGGPTRGAALAARLAALSCAGELPKGTVTAVGTGTFGSRAAIVVAKDLPDGTRSADAVLSDPCEVRPLD